MRIRSRSFGKRKVGLSIGNLYYSEYLRCIGAHIGYRSIYLDFMRKAK